MPGRALIDYGRLLDTIGIEAEVLLEAAHPSVFDAPVPTCPEWTLDRLARHMGSMYHSTLVWLVQRTRPTNRQFEPRAGEPTHEFVRRGLDGLRSELCAHDPAERAATWWPEDQTYGFWGRRMAHETVVHRIDAQNAASITLTDVAPELAIDGVDEVLSLWLGYRLAQLGLSGTREGTVAVCAGGYTWFADARPAGAVARQCTAEQAAQAHATVVGSPMQVYAWLWGRAGTSAVEYHGDHDAIGQLWALLRLATR